jgi:hypothetical protein
MEERAGEETEGEEHDLPGFEDKLLLLDDIRLFVHEFFDKKIVRVASESGFVHSDGWKGVLS